MRLECLGSHTYLRMILPEIAKESPLAIRERTSTYRLQLEPGFTFDDAARVAEYLKDLGVSHVYCSPYLQAAPGSKHGYDVVDYERPNVELGGEDGLDRFCLRLDELG